MVFSIPKAPPTLNLAFSAVVLLVGLIVYWFCHPRVFHDHQAVEKGFVFWVTKWMLFVMTWGLFTAQTDLRFVLATNDLNSVVGLALVVTLWQGDSYDERHTLTNLVFLFGLLLSWNFVGRNLIGPSQLWLFPSMTASVVSVSALGYVAVRRFRGAAIPFAIVSAGYVLLQLPTYQVVFIQKVSTDPELVTWLAFGKLLYGALFYTMFFFPIPDFQRIQLLSLPEGNGRLRRVATWTMTTVGGGILTELFLWLGKLAWHTIKPS